jgi:hypothetical protein
MGYWGATGAMKIVAKESDLFLEFAARARELYGKIEGAAHR